MIRRLEPWLYFGKGQLVSIKTFNKTSSFQDRLNFKLH